MGALERVVICVDCKLRLAAPAWNELVTEDFRRAWNYAAQVRRSLRQALEAAIVAPSNAGRDWMESKAIVDAFAVACVSIDRAAIRSVEVAVTAVLDGQLFSMGLTRDL